MNLYLFNYIKIYILYFTLYIYIYIYILIYTIHTTTNHYSPNHPSPFSVVIEHIKPSEKSREFLLELLTYINIPTHALKSYNFSNATVIIFL